jgi:hypothetical protein
MRLLVLPVLVLLSLGCGRTELVHYTDPPGDPPDAGRQLVPCVTGVFTPEPIVPAVMLVVDRSGSMNFDFAGNAGPPFGNPLTGPRRWAVLRASLENTLSRFDDRVAFGMVQFPGDGQCGVSSSIEVLPSVGNANELMAHLDGVPEGGTPTFGAITTAATQLASVRGQALVLITDGDPNCNAALDAATCDCTQPRLGNPPRCNDEETCRDAARVTEGLRGLRVDRGVVTYVVGVGSSSPAVVRALNDMARAGGVPKLGGTNAFYSGATETALAEALDAISTRLSRCTWATGTKLGPNDLVVVTVGGEVVPARVADGWDWADAASGDLVLRGAWCTRAAAGEEVRVNLECRSP